MQIEPTTKKTRFRSIECFEVTIETPEEYNIYASYGRWGKYTWLNYIRRDIEYPHIETISNSIMTNIIGELTRNSRATDLARFPDVQDQIDTMLGVFRTAVESKST